MKTLHRVMGKRILVTDDEQGVREAIAFLLRTDDHTVTQAQNGNEALAAIQGSKFDLVITDYSMPGMHGDELAKRIRELVPGQPIVMITAYADELANVQVDAVLPKPFEFNELRKTLRRLLS